MALAAIRRLREADQRVRSGNWGFAPLRPLHLPSAMTVGVIGTGRIGRHAASQFVGLGFRVLSYDIVESAEKMAGVQFLSSLEEVIVASDLISLHVPGAPDGTPLFNAELMSQLKPGSIIVNTSRGTLIDLKALAQGLAIGRPSYAALDVFAKEPPELTVFQGVEDQLLLTPHMAWYTEESESDLRFKAAHEVRRLLLGEREQHPLAGDLRVLLRPDEAPAARRRVPRLERRRRHRHREDQSLRHSHRHHLAKLTGWPHPEQEPCHRRNRPLPRFRGIPRRPSWHTGAQP